MAPLGLSAAMRKASEFGRRTLSLSLTPPRMVTPLARYPRRAHDAVIILQRGANPSTDYYLRPRLQGETAPVAIVDVETDPGDCVALARAEAAMVVVCRYISTPWLEALEAARSRLARVAFFTDDDLPGMMADPSLPLAVRGKVARHYGRHAARLSALAGEVWVSTPALAARYREAHAHILPPLPEADYPPPAPGAPLLVVYHSTDVHGAERRFVIEVARRLGELAPGATVEMTGDAATRRLCAGLANIRIVAQTAWPAYRDAQAGRSAAVSLAPLTPSAVNAARAPVKAFDAARLGAAGVFSDVAPYRGFVRDGVDGLLLPMDAQAWTEAIAGLLADAPRRHALAAAARARLAGLRREATGFPPGPTA